MNNYRVAVMQDPYPEDPREYSDMTTMWCWHNRYNLGDQQGKLNWMDYPGWGDIRTALYKEHNAVITLPVYLFDHSGLRMSTTPFGCRWDSGQVGFIFMTKEQVRAEYPHWKYLTSQRMQQLYKILTADVDLYDKYLSGDCYHWAVTDTETDEVVEGCSGYYDESTCRKDGQACAQRLYNQARAGSGEQLELTV